MELCYSDDDLSFRISRGPKLESLPPVCYLLLFLFVRICLIWDVFVRGATKYVQIVRLEKCLTDAPLRSVTTVYEPEVNKFQAGQDFKSAMWLT